MPTMSGMALAMLNEGDALRPKTRQGWARMKSIKTETGTSLVVIEREVESLRTPIKILRPDAPFVAQLIATAAGAAQTRILRRATPSDAIKGYGSVTARKIQKSKPAGECVSLVA